ncbi:hypothetical protein BSKO_11408 [Bryopsis sp. KO-2023]|nr:hypothetical protein BSKO_11408 [Bryopsis sp. KO-2023]
MAATICLTNSGLIRSSRRLSSVVRRGAFQRRGVVAMAAKIDSHLHVWAPKEQADKFPYMDGSTEPPVPGHAEVLIEAMESAQVQGALIVQPSNHKFDHSYVTSVLQRYPGKFVGCLLANPDDSGVGVSAMEALVKEDGYSCVRFNPYIWPEGQQMTNEVGRALYSKAGELGVPVGFMAFKGLLLHIEEIETLIKEFPNTRVIIDHFGFCKCSDPDSESWKRLIALAQFPQVYVKVSAFFRVSEMEYPYLDARVCLRRLVDAFGAQRLMWGSDFPWITQQCGYVKSWEILQAGDEATGEKLLTDQETEWIFGKTIQTIFTKGWQ